MFKANQEGKIADYLSAGVAEGKEAVLFGYSRGGNSAINVANALGKQGVNLSQLITFDAHSLSDGKTFQLKYNNVGQAHNFYQRNSRTGGRFGFWGSNPYWGSPVSSSHINVNQVNYTGANYRSGVPVSHHNIIRHSLGSF